MPAEATAPERMSAALAHFRAASRWRWGETLFWLAPVVAYFAMPAQLPLLTQAMVTGLFALSLDLLLGFAGIVSLGHAAFFGLGGYAAGLLAQQGWGEPLSGLLLGGLVAALLGYVTGVLVLRGGDLTRLMVTLGIAMMLFELANKLSWLTGGADGLQGVEVAPLFGIWQFDLYGRTAYVYAGCVLFVAFLLVRRVVHSPFGLALRGIKENRRRMSALGTGVTAHLLAAYTLGAALAGIAGALLTQTTQFVSLDVLGFDRSAEVLLIVILGGAGTLYGPLVGAIAFMTMQKLLSGVTPQYWQFWLGIVFIVLVLFGKGGIVGWSTALARRLARLRTTRPPAAATAR